MAVAGGVRFVWAAGAGQVPQFLGLLALMLFAARVLGGLVQRAGQPAVLGELLAGVLLGPSVIGQLYPPLAVNPETEVMQVLAELGVLILLFEIGLETDLKNLLRVGGAAAAVAVVGVALPFVLGYAVCRSVGLGGLPSVQGCTVQVQANGWFSVTVRLQAGESGTATAVSASSSATRRLPSLTASPTLCRSTSGSRGNARGATRSRPSPASGRTTSRKPWWWPGSSRTSGGARKRWPSSTTGPPPAGRRTAW